MEIIILLLIARYSSVLNNYPEVREALWQITKTYCLVIFVIIVINLVLYVAKCDQRAIELEKDLHGYEMCKKALLDVKELLKKWRK